MRKHLIYKTVWFLSWRSPSLLRLTFGSPHSSARARPSWHSNLKTTIYQFNLIGFLLPISSVCAGVFHRVHAAIWEMEKFKNSTMAVCFFRLARRKTGPETNPVLDIGQPVYKSQNMAQSDVMCGCFFVFIFQNIFYHLRIGTMKKKVVRVFLHQVISWVQLNSLKKEIEKSQPLISTNFQINARRLQKKWATKTTVADAYVLHLKIWRFGIYANTHANHINRNSSRLRLQSKTREIFVIFHIIKRQFSLFLLYRCAFVILSISPNRALRWLNKNWNFQSKKGVWSINIVQ